MWSVVEEKACAYFVDGVLGCEVNFNFNGVATSCVCEPCEVGKQLIPRC